MAATQFVTTSTPPVAAEGGNKLEPLLEPSTTLPVELQLDVQVTGVALLK
jgi:hypothetical protein